MKQSSWITVALMLACGGERGGDTVIVGMRSDFEGINSITSSAQYTQELINYALFTPLVHYDEKLGVQPRLAESWELQGDTAVVMRLRSDVRWHDGRPVTAADVQFTFDRAKEPATASPLLASAFLTEVAAAELLDSLTIRFRFARPHAQALEDFFWAPMPRHLLESIPPAELRNAPFNRQPVGNGPFRFVEWRANEMLVLAPNPDYPAALGGPPAAARLVFRIIPEASTRSTDLVTGGIHVNIDVTPDDIPNIEARPGEATLHAFPGRTVYYLGWNNARAPFNDVRVRRGLALAVNRQAIIDALLRGHGALAESTIPPWHPLTPDVAPLQHSAEESARVLDAAGWRDRNGDGIRENAQGQPLRFTMISSDDPVRRAAVEILQSQLRAAGADAQIRIMEFQTMRQQHRNRDFEAIFTNWVLDNFQVASAPYALFHSSQAEREGSANRSTVKIPRLDALIERGATAVAETEQRNAWAEFARVLQEEQPVTFMFWVDELAASSTRLQGVTMDPRGELRTIPAWSFGAR
jgi:peptide/nickel transport system substrate-binding protein